jgi:hypothetical protein
MHDPPPEPKGYGETPVLPGDGFAPRTAGRMLIEDQPATFVIPRAVPEDASIEGSVWS